jgi:hypothetical protein
MVVSQTMPSLEYASAMALAGFGVSEPSSASLLTAKILGADREGFGYYEGGWG